MGVTQFSLEQKSSNIYMPINSLILEFLDIADNACLKYILASNSMS